MQIWNLNAATGVVGVFNLQGASWDRSRRRFHVHNTAPPELTSKRGGMGGDGLRRGAGGQCQLAAPTSATPRCLS